MRKYFPKKTTRNARVYFLSKQLKRFVRKVKVSLTLRLNLVHSKGKNLVLVFQFLLYIWIKIENIYLESNIIICLVILCGSITTNLLKHVSNPQKTYQTLSKMAALNAATHRETEAEELSTIWSKTNPSGGKNWRPNTIRQVHTKRNTPKKLKEKVLLYNKLVI